MKNVMFKFSNSNTVYTSLEFKVWYNLKEILEKKGDLVMHEPEPLMVKKFNGDLYGYLSTLDLDNSLFPLILLLNGFKSTKDFGVNKKVIFLPKNSEYLIDKIKNNISTIRD